MTEGLSSDTALPSNGAVTCKVIQVESLNVSKSQKDMKQKNQDFPMLWMRLTSDLQQAKKVLGNFGCIKTKFRTVWLYMVYNIVHYNY